MLDYRNTKIAIEEGQDGSSNLSIKAITQDGIALEVGTEYRRQIIGNLTTATWEIVGFAKPEVWAFVERDELHNFAPEDWEIPAVVVKIKDQQNWDILRATEVAGYFRNQEEDKLRKGL